MKVEIWSLDRIQPYEKNARKIPQKAVDKVAASLLEYGWQQPIVLDVHGVIVVGHTRYLAAKQLGWNEAPVHVADKLTPSQIRAYRLADNRTHQESDWDLEILGLEIGELRGLDLDLSLTGFDSDELRDFLSGRTESEATARTLAERFCVPPFSVLDARQGYWQERKRAWLSLGIQSELGRGDAEGRPEKMALHSGGGFADALAVKRAWANSPNSLANFTERFGHGDTATETGARIAAVGTGTSIFDPVLCELAYRWFCPLGGAILDPFAGGSVRGIVASKLGRRYRGIDLSARQIEANRDQAVRICTEPMPEWIEGDATDISEFAPGEYDFLFSCPPYGALEVYSDDPRDLSTMGHPAYLGALRAVVQTSLGLLKPDRFACFVVGDIRDDAGFYRRLVSDVEQSFVDAGALLYNAAILVTAVGSLPIRVGAQFTAARKLGKTHQNVLVFCKGDPRRATEAVGVVECGEIEVLG